MLKKRIDRPEDEVPGRVCLSIGDGLDQVKVWSRRSLNDLLVIYDPSCDRYKNDQEITPCMHTAEIES